MSPHSVSSHSGSDAESESSTIVYEHEPFDTFRDRALSLARGKLWPGIPAKDIAVERMRGGGFNRIIGLNLLTGEHTQYILRVPRFDTTQLDRDVAALCFIQRHSRVPAPRVVTFDETEENELNYPYMVQNRIAGKDLYTAYPELDHCARCRIAKALGGVFRQLLAVRSSMPGRLVLPEDEKRLDAPLHVAPFPPTDPPVSIEYTGSSSVQSVYELLTTAFKTQKAEALELDSNDTVGSTMIDDFINMTSQLDAAGWLAGVPYTLAHLDLAPRNILVKLASNLEQPIISAILDWDSALLAPMFMSCTPPLWLWAWQDDEDEDERTANHGPPTPEGYALKQLFEAAAGPSYLKYAYDPVYRLARCLTRFAFDGVRSNEDYKEAKIMLQEWSSIHQAGFGASPVNQSAGQG